MDDKSQLDIDWAAIVDIFASEYGWTIDVIKNLDLSQVISLVKTIKARYRKQSDSVNQGDNDTGSEEEMAMHDLERLGKTVIREDGTKEIII